MAVIFTARLRVHNWRALLRHSDETLLIYARTAGACRYRLYRNAHDAAEALLLVEAATSELLRPFRDALLQLEGIRAGGATGSLGGALWEPAGCRAIEAEGEGGPGARCGQGSFTTGVMNSHCTPQENNHE